MNTPKVFISYSWDDSRHKSWVLNLARALADNGVEVILDQFELQLGRNLTHFMERSVKDADKVLLIMTKNFKLKAEGRQGGVGYEFSMINAEWYKNQTDNNKFIPILRGADRKASVPVFVNTFVSLDMRDDANWDENIKALLRTIFNEPKIKKPELGKKPTFRDVQIETKIEQVSEHTQPNNSTENAIKAKRLAHNKEKVRTFLGDNEIAEAITLLEIMITETKNTDLAKEIILHESQYNSYRRNQRLGLLDNSESKRAKIVYNLLHLLDEIK